MSGNYLVYDIENMGVRGWAWGLYEQDLLHIDHQQHLLCISFKWLGTKKVHNMAIWDYPLYKKDPHSDKALAEAFWPIINRADVLIGHNIKSFDNKMITSMFLRHKMKPPAKYASVDTLKEAKKLGRFTSNKLDDLGELMGHGNKQKHEGFGLWLKSDEGVKRAQREMVSYNNRDVQLTEELYLDLLPWIDNHPSRSLLEDKPDKCPNCAKGPVVEDGETPAGKVSWKIKYVCRNCGAQLKGRPTIRSNVKYIS